MVTIGRRPALRPLGIGVLLGLIVGVPVGLLLGHHIDAGWLVAVGTVVLAIATVGLWLDSRAHRLDERDAGVKELQRREQQDQAAELRAKADDLRATEQQEQAEVDAAALVELVLYGGAGNGGGDVIQGTSVHFDIINGGARPITRISVGTEPGVTFKSNDGIPPVVAPGGHYRWTRETQEFDMPRAEASGRPMLSHAPVLRFSLGGQMWERRGNAAPHRLTAPD